MYISYLYQPYEQFWIVSRCLQSCIKTAQIWYSDCESFYSEIKIKDLHLLCCLSLELTSYKIQGDGTKEILSLKSEIEK